MGSREMQHDFIKTAHRFGRIQWDGILSGLTQGEFGMLQAIVNCRRSEQEQGGIYVSTLAQELNATMPNVSRMLKNLERQGLIRRDVDSNNRRKTFVCLTEKGERKRTESQKVMEVFADKTVNAMGAQNMEQLLYLWNRLADVIEQSIAEIKEEGI